MGDSVHSVFNGVCNAAATITPTDGAGGDVPDWQVFCTFYDSASAVTSGVVAVTTRYGDEEIIPWAHGAWYQLELSRVRATGTSPAGVRAKVFGLR